MDLLAELLSPYKRAVAGEEYDLSLDPIYGTLAQFQPQASVENGDPLQDLLGSPGPGGGIKKQLIQGFLDAGHPELARMVRTPEFKTWVGAESGWNPKAVSPANNQGKANHWLFQFWAGHPWVQDILASGRNPSPYEQAKLAATKFSLTPNDIRTYDEQIRAGTYKGWG